MDSKKLLHPRSPSSPEAVGVKKLRQLDQTWLLGKVSMVALCVPTGTIDSYNIYTVDLDSEYGDGTDGFLPRAPMLRIESGCLDHCDFCVLGSTIYMFQGCKPGNDEKSVFMYELPSSPDYEIFNLKLEKSMLVELTPMHHVKFSPVALPTPDCKKILVFSSKIMFYYYEKCDFELYDVVARSWRKLPGLCNGWGTTFNIKAHTFISKSVVLVQTEIGIFTLDFESPDGTWERLDRFHGGQRIPFDSGSFLVIDNDLCLTPLYAYDIENENGFTRQFCFPELSLLGARYILTTRAITLLDHVNNRECRFCIMQSQLNRDTMEPHLIVNVYHCDLIKYRQDKKKVEDKDKEQMRRPLLPGISILRTFKFLLSRQDLDWFYIDRLFSIPASVG